MLHLKDEKDKAKFGIPSYLEKPIELANSVLNLIRSQVLEQDQIYQFNIYGGFSQEIHPQEIATNMNNLYEALEKGTLKNDR